jgi:hypothetical protein
MRALLLILSFLILRLVDTFTTWILTSSGQAIELNPTVNTDFLGCVFYAERNSQKFETISKKGIFPSCPFYFPVYYLFLLIIVCISNLLGVLEIGTPIALIATPFEHITDSTDLQFTLGYTSVILVTLPVAIPLVRRLYSPTQIRLTRNSDSATR